ncbi:Uncharacterised protein [Chromobacterium violaceum]|uniref:Uncharacterized protein n=1 Tax=Chromobacterium violaceum TaxID=536 RepID=A0A3S4LG68_CHRVL|nr:Uncharacterised protein [Chromobacterium violaceum]
MSVFFGGTVFGRLVSSRLLARFDGRNMLMAVILLGGVAILGLWASALPPSPSPRWRWPACAWAISSRC